MMNKNILLLIGIVMVGASACREEADNKKKVDAPQKPVMHAPDRPLVEQSPKEDTSVIPNQDEEGKNVPPFTSSDTKTEKDDEAVLPSNDGQNSSVVFSVQPECPLIQGNQTFAGLPRLTWSKEDQEYGFRFLTEVEFYNIGKFDLEDKVLLVCLFHSKKVVENYLLASAKFLEDKKTNDGFGWTQVFTFDQKIGKWDFSFSGLYKWFAGNNIQKTEPIVIDCVEIK